VSVPGGLPAIRTLPGQAGVISGLPTTQAQPHSWAPERVAVTILKCLLVQSWKFAFQRAKLRLMASRVSLDGSWWLADRRIPGHEGETWDIRLPAHGTNSVAVGILLLKFCDDQMC
jgi:hypothetical protein